MNNDITYNGYTAQPSDYECQDGELALALNLIPEDGAIKPLLPPKSLFSVPDGYKAFRFTPPSGIRLFIFFKIVDNSTSVLVCDNEGNTLPDVQISINDKINTINAMGNTLMFLGDLSIHYYLWKPDENNFRPLEYPKIDIDLALRLHLKSRSFDANISLVDSSQLQTGSNAWETIRSASLSGNFEYDHYTGIHGESHHFHLVTLSSLNIKKGKEYRFTFNRQGNDRYDLELYIYKRRLIAETECPSCSYGYSYAADLLFKFFTWDYQTTIIAPYDIDNLYCYVVTHPTGTIPDSSVNLSLTIEVSEIEHLDIEDSKIISYTPEAVNAVAAAMNVMINEEATAKNRFIYPFFVRYALRMYDGSNIMPSAPRLMIPNSDYVPLVLFRSAAPQLQAIAFIAELQYRINNISSLSDWSDIITGIDVFVSPSAWPYDQAADYDQKIGQFDYTLLTDHDMKTFGIGSLVHNNIELSGGEHYDQPLMINVRNNFDIDSYQPMCVRLGLKSKEDFMKQFYSSSMANFYHLFNIDFNKVTPSNIFVTPDLPDGILSSLVSRPILEENFINYEGFEKAKSHVYNNRLHIFDASPILPAPQTLLSLNPFHCDTYDILLQEIYVKLSTIDGQKIVKKAVENSHFDFTHLHSYWFFYPDSRATEALFTFKNEAGVIKSMTLPLTPHPFMSGSYAIVSSFDNSFDNLITLDEEELPQVDKSIHSKSSIFISEINNPFIFRTGSTVNIGASEVKALTSAAKALSQGQFGQFPLYAFTDEGVWALEISSSGSYSARQPITRDVCKNTDGITQLDSAVLFPTDRGIMLISGSQTQCISDSINSDTPFDALSLPKMDILHSMLGHDPDSCLPLAPFFEFLKECGMLYDYVHQRIIVYSPKYTYAYVYSLKSKKWGMMYSTIETRINSYPEALAVDHDGNLLDFSDTTGIPSNGLLVTRPVKLGLQNVHKTIDTIIQRGNFAKGNVKSVLYGSRDLINWHLVWSSKDHFLRGFRGTPYKYFRIACVASLSDKESIYGASVQFTPRITNQPR